MLSLLLAHALSFHVALTSSMLAPPDATSIGSNISELASDAMNGRSFRSVDGKTAAAWVATKLAQAGATPLAGRTDMQVPIARMPEANSFLSLRITTIFPTRAVKGTSSTTAPMTTRVVCAA